MSSPLFIFPTVHVASCPLPAVDGAHDGGPPDCSRDRVLEFSAQKERPFAGLLNSHPDSRRTPLSIMGVQSLFQAAPVFYISLFFDDFPYLTENLFQRQSSFIARLVFHPFTITDRPLPHSRHFCRLLYLRMKSFDQIPADIP